VNHPDLITGFISYFLFFFSSVMLFIHQSAVFYRFIDDWGNTFPARFKSRFERDGICL